jgi:hypothetical protein
MACLEQCASRIPFVCTRLFILSVIWKSTMKLGSKLTIGAKGVHSEGTIILAEAP